MSTIWSYCKTHLFYLIVIAIGLIAFRSWLIEHDNRLISQQAEVVADRQVKDLQAQVAAIKEQAARQVQVIKQQVTAVKTPAQAVAIIPTISEQPLAAVVSATDPTKIEVDPIALVKELGQCREDSVQLSACTLTEQKKDAEIKARDAEIATLKKPRGFWKRVGSALKVAGIAFGVGVAAGAHGI